MSQFPAIKPTGRSFTAGSVPVSSFRSMSGKETRVIMGDKMHGHKVALKFGNVQEDVAERITDHWYGRQGTVLSFRLPNAVWAGWAQYASAVASTQIWRYAKEPKLDAVSPGIMNVSVELVALA